MDVSFVAQQLARHIPFPSNDLVIWNMAVLTDAEWVMQSTKPPVEVNAFVQSFCPQKGRLLLIESLLPEIRLIAIFLAAQRIGAARKMPVVKQWTDAADWLAARILFLELSHVILTEETLPLLNQANRRLARLSTIIDMPVPLAEPLLRMRRVVIDGEKRQHMLPCVSRLTIAVDQYDIASVLKATSMLRKICRERHAGWLSHFERGTFRVNKPGKSI